MDDEARFDRRGYLVRLIFGCKPQVFALPGCVESQVWRFENGVAIKDPSMTDALALAHRISHRSRK